MAQRPRVRRLGPADLAAMVELQLAVAAGLPQGFIRPKTASELRVFLEGAVGVAYGIGEDGALLAMSLLRLLDESHRHAPLPFPLVPDEDWPLRVSFLENTMVRPEARGRGYHRALIDARAAYARAAGIRWICAGVHLRNRSSWANLLASGMVIVGIRFDPGYPIIGLLKSTDVSALDVDADDQVRVDGGDEAGHGSILEDGYVGVRLAADGGVVYHRLMRN